MNQLNPKNQIIGIVGGGQLGRMTILEARRLDIQVRVLTPEHPSPASDIADGHIVGSLYDEAKIRELAADCQVLSYEIEHIDIATLKALEEEGTKVYPSSRVLEIIQDKSAQKKFLEEAGLPTSKWAYVNKDNLDQQLEDFGFPVVQKACKGGYDGKGVAVLKSEDDRSTMLKTESFFEEYVPFKKELAVMVARNVDGQTAVYPVVEMEFDPDTNICDITVTPARVSAEIQAMASSIALKAVEALDGVGVFGVELFLTDENEILINEIAPRPHNSGHYTIEGCMTSQYEQYLRAILNLPLGSTELIRPNVMINLLGEPGYSGPVDVLGYPEAMALPKTYIHLYGKRETKPNRKMGHVTVLADNVETALKRAKQAKKAISIISRNLD